MLVPISDFTTKVQAHLDGLGVSNSVKISEACAFLQVAAYPGLEQLLEALNDPVKELKLVKDALGYDLKTVSCVYLMDQVGDMVEKHGRIFLRNVRHGLYLLPDSVASNYGIGCPVDPSFHLGGDRAKNPYTEKFEIAMRDGLNVDEKLWNGLKS
jgi:hypothetical protein